MDEEKFNAEEEVVNAEEEVKIKEPMNPLVILAVILVAVAILTYFVPAGEFDRTPVEGQDYEAIDVDSFHYVAKNPTTPVALLKSFTLGLQGASDIIFFLLIIGGAFQVVTATGALDAGLSNLVYKMKGKEKLFIPICILVFSLISAVAACCEEYLAFLPLMYVICVAMGFDSLTAVALLFGASAVGYAGGMMNAFTVGVAQGIAGINNPPFNGMWYRFIVWGVLAIVTIIYVYLHAHKIKEHPEKNTMLAIDKKYAEAIDTEKPEPVTGRQKIVLLLFGLSFVAVGVCVLLPQFGWFSARFPDYEFYMDEMSALFLVLAILAGLIGGLGVSKTADEFAKGCGNLLWAGLIIGLCKAITMVMQDAGIMDTLIYTMGNVLMGLPKSATGIGMFVLQDLLNVLIPSGSGQAAVTMPFMAPLSDVLGIPRQCAVLAFQMGDAFTNVITPTSGELMAALAICHIPYKKWFQYWGPMWGIWCVFACIFMVIAVTIGYH